MCVCVCVCVCTRARECVFFVSVCVCFGLSVGLSVCLSVCLPESSYIFINGCYYNQSYLKCSRDPIELVDLTVCLSDF